MNDNNVPPPAATPQLKALPAEEKTDPLIRVVAEKMHSELNWQGAKLTVATAVIAVGTAFAAFTFIHNDARAQTDAGMKPVVETQKAQDARLTTLEKRFDRFEERNDKQMNLLLDEAGVPKSKRPPPLERDGGE